MYMPAQLKDSKKISAVFSRFSGGFRGCGLVRHTAGEFGEGLACRFCEQKEVIFGLYSQVLEDGI
jgi:hypothetical protein